MCTLQGSSLAKAQEYFTLVQKMATEDQTKQALVKSNEYVCIYVTSINGTALYYVFPFSALLYLCMYIFFHFVEPWHMCFRANGGKRLRVSRMY